MIDSSTSHNNVVIAVMQSLLPHVAVTSGQFMDRQMVCFAVHNLTTSHQCLPNTFRAIAKCAIMVSQFSLIVGDKMNSCIALCRDIIYCDYNILLVVISLPDTRFPHRAQFSGFQNVIESIFSEMTKSSYLVCP